MKLRPDIPSDPEERQVFYQAVNFGIVMFFFGIAVGFEIAGVSDRAVVIALAGTSVFAFVGPRLMRRVSAE